MNEVHARRRWLRLRLAASAVLAVAPVIGGAAVGTQVFGDHPGTRTGDPATSADPADPAGPPGAPGSPRRPALVSD